MWAEDPLARDPAGGRSGDSEALAPDFEVLLDDQPGLIVDEFKSIEERIAHQGRRLDREIAALVRTAKANPPVPGPLGITFRQFAEQWTSGQLNDRYPDHVGMKRTSDDDRQRLRAYVYAVMGDVPLVQLVGAPGLERADEVMSKLPKLSSQTRRHVAQTMHRVFAMATYPARLIPASPLPKGWLPRVKSVQAQGYLYPDEDAKLLACGDVPLVYRLLYGFLAREGCRPSEAPSEGHRLEVSARPEDAGPNQLAGPVHRRGPYAGRASGPPLRARRGR